MTKTDRITALRGKTISVTHRVELIDQGTAYPAHIVNADPIPYNKDADWMPGAIVMHDYKKSPAKRWDMCGDARVRPEHQTINHQYGKMTKRPDPWRDGVGYNPTAEQITELGRAILGDMIDTVLGVPIDLGRFDCAGRYRVPYIQMMGRGLRALPGYAQGLKDDRLYHVYPKKIGRRVRYLTVYYSSDTFYMKRSISKRRELAIQKGEAWLNG